MHSFRIDQHMTRAVVFGEREKEGKKGGKKKGGGGGGGKKRRQFVMGVASRCGFPWVTVVCVLYVDGIC